MKKSNIIITSLILLLVVTFSVSINAESLPDESYFMALVNAEEIYLENEDVIISGRFNIPGDYEKDVNYDWIIEDADGNLIEYEKIDHGQQIKVPNKPGEYTVYFNASLGDDSIKSREEVFYVSHEDEIDLSFNINVPEDTPEYNSVFIGYAINNPDSELNYKPDHYKRANQIDTHLWEVSVTVNPGDNVRVTPNMGNAIGNRALSDGGGQFVKEYIAYESKTLDIEVPAWMPPRVRRDENIERDPVLLIDDKKENSYRIIWQDNKELKPIKYGIVGEDPNEINPTETKLGKEAYLKELETDEEYFYIINEEEYHFKTADNSKTFDFIAFTDTQNFPETIKEGYELIGNYNPDIILSAGDLMDDGYRSDHWKDTFFGPATPLLSEIPFAASTGNHEELTPLYLEYFGYENRWFAHKYNNVNFIYVDAYSTFHEGSPQYEFIKKELQKDADWKIVISHEAPYSDVPRHFSNMEMRAELAPLYEKYDVDLKISGHVHTYFRSEEINGVQYVSLPSMGSYTASEDEQAGEEGFDEKIIYDREGFGLFQINNDKLNVNIIDLEGEVMDEFVIEKN